MEPATDTDSPFHPDAGRGEDRFELNLRPRSFDSFVGQRSLVENLHLAMDGILSNLEAGDLLFIDEIHRLPRPVDEVLYSAMEDYVVDVILDQGPAARSIRLALPHFTLIGATTREGLLSSPFRARFGMQEKLELYPADELAEILLRSAGALKVQLSSGAAEYVSERARGTPRVANRFLRRIRDLAQEHYDNKIDEAVAREGLGRLGVDERGFSLLDRRILEAIVRHGGGPIGLKTIAVSVGEDDRTIEDVYEPFLIRSGFLQRTPQGRRASPACMDAFGGGGQTAGRDTGSLFDS